MLRNLSKLAAKNVQGIIEKTGTILARGPAPGSYEVAIDGNRHTQVWSANGLNYAPGARVTVLIKQGIPIITP